MRVLLYVTSLLILVGCDLLDQKHPHAHDNETNLVSDAHHDHEDHALDGQHNQDDHAHAEEATIALTHFSKDTELFVEFPALVVGHE